MGIPEDLIRKVYGEGEDHIQEAKRFEDVLAHGWAPGGAAESLEGYAVLVEPIKLLPFAEHALASNLDLNLQEKAWDHEMTMRLIWRIGTVMQANWKPEDLAIEELLLSPC